MALAAWDRGASVIGATIAAACLGFLVFNWSPAKIFMGDVGSGLLGYVFAVLPLMAPMDERPRAVLCVALSLWLFLADATWTLLRRVTTGARGSGSWAWFGLTAAVAAFMGELMLARAKDASGPPRWSRGEPSS